MLNVAPVNPIAKGILADSAPAALSTSPGAPPPPLSSNDYDSDDDDSDSDDGEDGDDDHLTGNDLSLLPPSPTPSTIEASSASTSLLPSISSPRSGDSSSTDDTSSLAKTSLTTSTIASNSNSEPPTSADTSATVSGFIYPITTLHGTSTSHSTGTSLPIGQTNSDTQHKVATSPMTIAGIVAASVFGFIALVLLVCFLYRMRRRRKVEAALIFDSEKLPSDTSRHHDTNTAYGHDRQTNGPRSIPNPYAQQAEQPRSTGRGRGRGRSRFSFLNRRWYSTGSQVSYSQYQQRDMQIPAEHKIADVQSSDSPLGTLAPSRAQESQLRPRSSSIFTRLFLSTLTRYSSSPKQVPAVPTGELNRSTSTRTTASSTSNPGSGHARAYAHHGVTPPRSSIVNAARDTISSISSRWWLGRRSGTETVSSLSSMSSVPSVTSLYSRSRFTVRYGQDIGRDSLVSPLSEQGDAGWNSRTGSTLQSLEILPSSVYSERGGRTDTTTATNNSGPNSVVQDQHGIPDDWRNRPRPRPRSQEGRTNMPRLPLPVVINRDPPGRF